MLAASVPAFAYSQSGYHAKATELRTLIEECKALGINTQYEEIDANIIDIYADRIATFQSGGVSSSITSYQLTELDTLYSNAKTKLNAYKNGTKTAPSAAYTYRTGNVYRADGASLKNNRGVPYFSAGFGHFGMSGYVEELSSYGYDNIQAVTSLADVVTADRAIDGWDQSKNGGVDITFTPVTNMGRSNNTSLHVVNNSGYAANVYGKIYQRVPVKPGTEYNYSFYVRGTSKNGACVFKATDSREIVTDVPSDSWMEIKRTFTTGSDQYFKDLELIFEKECDIYIDDINISIKGKGRNAVNNGGFDGDGSDDFDIFYNTNTSLQETLRTLNAAEKNNSHVEVLLQLQQNMPTCITDKYPEIGTSGRYNIDHAVAQQVEKAYIESVVGTLSDYLSLGSIIVANEPSYNSSDYSYNYDTKFATYLTNKYGALSTLKSAYGNNSYSSFSSVGRPIGFEESARFYDWKSFNDGIFTSWYRKTVNTIKSCADVPVSIKIQADFLISDRNNSYDTRKQMAMGIDAEALGDLSDYHGNDSNGTYDEGTIRNAMKWYDYLGSISDKPIYDSEKHITDSDSSYYNDDITKFTKNSAWISMLHGLDMFSIWTWSLDTDSSSSRYGHLAMRPSALAEAAHATLDANRLASKVTAIANAAPTAAILRDDASRIYNKRYMHALSFAYNAATEAGHKVGFVTPSNIASTLSDYDVLIIPYATNVESNVIDAINDFTGKIVMMDSSSLGKDQYNKSYSGSTLTKINNIKSRAVTLSVTGESSILVSGYQFKIKAPTKATIKTELVKDRTVTVVSGSSLCDNLEWQYVPYQNGYLVSINNFDTSSSRTVTVKLNGTAFSKVTSLNDMQDIASNITLPKMTGGLYYVRNTNDEISDNEYGSSASQEITVETNRIISLTASRSGRVNSLSWTSAEGEGPYNIYSVNADGSQSFITSTQSHSYEEMSDSAKTYSVECVTVNGEEGGKFATAGVDLDDMADISSTCTAGKTDISFSLINDRPYSVAYTFTATSYNEDTSFNGAAIMEQLVPSGETASFAQSFDTVGTGTVVVTIR